MEASLNTELQETAREPSRWPKRLVVGAMLATGLGHFVLTPLPLSVFNVFAGLGWLTLGLWSFLYYPGEHPRKSALSMGLRLLGAGLLLAALMSNFA